MSTENMDVATPEGKRKQKYKDKSGSKSSKKRRRDEQSQTQSNPDPASEAEVDTATTIEHRKKKRRRNERHGSTEEELKKESTQHEATPSLSVDTPERTVKSKKKRRSKGEEAAQNDCEGKSIGEDEEQDVAEETKEVKSKRNKKRRKGEHEAEAGESQPQDQLMTRGAVDSVQDNLPTSSKESSKAKGKKQKNSKLVIEASESEREKTQLETTLDGAESKKKKVDIRLSTEVSTQVPKSPIRKLQEKNADHKPPFARTTASFLVPLAPQAYGYPLQGLCAEHLSPLLLTYYPPLRGIILAYHKPRLSESPAHVPPYIPEPSLDSINSKDATRIKPEPNGVNNHTNGTSSTESDSDSSTSSATDSQSKHPKTATGSQPTVLAQTADEYAPPFIWLTAEFDVLRPRRGALLQGTVQVQNPSWLGLVCWNWFNAGVPRRRIPKGWRFVEGGGGIANGKAGKGRKTGPNGGGGETDGDGDGDIEMDGDDGAEEDVDAGAARNGDAEMLDGEGYWVDEKGARVRGAVEFRLRDFEHMPSSERDNGFISIEGTLLSEEEDRSVDAEMKAEMKGDRGRGKRRRIDGTEV